MMSSTQQGRVPVFNFVRSEELEMFENCIQTTSIWAAENLQYLFEILIQFILVRFSVVKSGHYRQIETRNC